MSDESEIRPWQELEEIAEAGDAEALEEFIENLSPGDAARAFARMPDEEQAKVLTTLTPGDAADLIEDMPEAQAADLIEHLPPQEAAAIVSEMESNDQADLIGALDRADAEAVLAEMAPEEAADARRLASYAADVVGGLMITEHLQYPESASVQEITADLHRRAEDYAEYDVQYAYVTSRAGSLVGVVPLRQLLLQPGERRVDAVMVRDPLSVRDDASLDEVAEFFDRHQFLGVPVVDAETRLIGVVRRADVEEAMSDRAGADYMKSQGIVGEELRTMKLYRRATRRLSWLSVNVVLNVMAASVIALYEDTLSSVIALAVFLPIVSDMSGCSGNQAVAVSMRELTLGLVKPADVLWVWLKELSVGVINGLALGVMLAVVAWAWKGNAWLGLVVGGALALNTVVAVSIGGAVPLVLKRWGRDPALASGPILTTITDVCGFFFVLSFASLVLPRLTEG